MSDTGISQLFNRERSAEEIRAEFNAALDELCLFNAEIAQEMMELGDYRPFDTVMRSLQRMRSGETRVSGEMAALVQMLLRRQRRLLHKHHDLRWTENQHGERVAQTDDYLITLAPKSKGRWLVHLQHKATGYCPPWPSWQDSLDIAKKRALICMERADDWLVERALEPH